MYVFINVCVCVYEGGLAVDVVIKANCDQINNRNAEEVCMYACMYVRMYID